MEKGRVGNVAAFSMRDAQRLGRRPHQRQWKGKNAPTNGDDENARKLNPNLIDPSGTALHLV
jgi:hypothetical protein